MTTSKLCFLALIYLLNLNSLCAIHCITVKYNGNSDVNINLMYSFIEIGNSNIILNKSNRILSIYSNTPQTIKCVDVSRNTIIYVEPNETIDINVDKRGMLLYNSNKSTLRALESMFINDCYLKYGPAEPVLIKRMLSSLQNNNLKSFKIDALYLGEKKLLNEYYSKHNISPKFYEYFNLVLWCLTLENKLNNPKEQADGFVELRKSFINADNLINIYQYRNCLLAYCHYLMKNSKINTDLISSLQFIKNNFSNQTIINYLMYNKLKNHILNKSFKIDYNTLNLFYTNCKNKEFIEDIKKDIVQKVNSIYLKKIIKESGCKLAVIDFWASWCKPCLEELPYAKRMINSYPQVKYIFVSIDKSKTDWLKSTKMKSDIFNSTNSFLLSEINDENILSKLNITTIPRFVLLNHKGEMINSNFFRPSDLNFKLAIDNYLK